AEVSARVQALQSRWAQQRERIVARLDQRDTPYFGAVGGLGVALGSPWEDAAPSPIVVIAASAGGIEAILQMSAELPEDFPGALVVALHRGRGSSSRLLDVLNRVSRLRVVEACIGGILEPSTIVLSPVGAHVLIGSGGRIHLEARTAKLVCPSADRLLASVA